MGDDLTGYEWADSGCTNAHGFLLPVVKKILSRHFPHPSPGMRIFDLGCGNGSIAQVLHQAGWTVSGIDASEEGIGRAHDAYPHLDLQQASIYDDLPVRFGTYPLLLSLEVVEHLYFPRKFASAVFGLLQPGGMAVISTPYHGYLKNLALALTGKFDQHFTVLWEHGHIKFWSVRTLSALLREAGLEVLEVHRVGRIPVLAKSMILVARRPA